MAASNFNAVMDEIFKHEGGLSMLRSDPGNWSSGKVGVGELRGTNFGIAAHAHPKEDIRNLTKERAREIYRMEYWRPIQGDSLPYGIDLVTMDPAVNSGVSRGVRWLQQAMGFTGKDLDGHMGQNTLAATKKADAVTIIQKACAKRMNFLRALRTWDTFGRGWSRRVASVEAVAVRMAVTAKGENARNVLAYESSKAQTSAIDKTQQAGATGAGGAAAGTGITLADLPTWGLIGFGVFVLLIIVLLLSQKNYQEDRANAYQDEALKVKP
jgi:lysozyme family protein